MFQLEDLSIIKTFPPSILQKVPKYCLDLSQLWHFIAYKNLVCLGKAN